MSDQRQSKYDTIIRTQSSSLCNVSKLIRAYLQINGGTVDLKVLLPSLDIHESPDDIIELLVAGLCTYSLTFAIQLRKIGIERALLICDELCTPVIIDEILNIGERLDRLYEYKIINHRCDSPDICKAYNNGYQPIPHNGKSYYILNTTLLNTAFDNGLYISNSTLYLCDFDVINSNYTKDITNLHFHNFTGSKKMDEIWNLENVKKLMITYACVLQYDNACHIFERVAKQLECIKIMDSGCTINDTHLELCVNLKELYADNNKCIKKCTQQYAKSLRLISASVDRVYDCSIGSNCLLLCTNLKILNAHNNPNIITCAPFAHSLVALFAGQSNCYVERNGLAQCCGIGNDGLRLCTRLKILHCANNIKITTCSPFAKTLRILDASRMCGIGDDGLKLCTRLTYLNASDNNDITTCASFANSLKFIRNGCYISDLEQCVKLYHAAAKKSNITTTTYNTLRIVKFMNMFNLSK